MLPNEKEILHASDGKLFFALNSHLSTINFPAAQRLAVGFIDWLGGCSRSIRKDETPEQRTEVFQ